MPSYIKYCRGRKAKRKIKTRDFFAWTDDKVELLLKVTHKVVMAVVSIDWESHRDGHVVNDKTKHGSRGHRFQKYQVLPV